jgi:hypothetical protein
MRRWEIKYGLTELSFTRCLPAQDIIYSGSYCRYFLLVYNATKRYLTEHFGSGGNAANIREAPPDANIGRAIVCHD